MAEKNTVVAVVKDGKRLMKDGTVRYSLRATAQRKLQFAQRYIANGGNMYQAYVDTFSPTKDRQAIYHSAHLLFKDPVVQEHVERMRSMERNHIPIHSFIHRCEAIVIADRARIMTHCRTQKDIDNLSYFDRMAIARVTYFERSLKGSEDPDNRKVRDIIFHNWAKSMKLLIELNGWGTDSAKPQDSIEHLLSDEEIAAQMSRMMAKKGDAIGTWSRKKLEEEMAR